MALILSPEPGIYSGANLTVHIGKTSDIVEYAVTQDGIPPVIAKYIAYDNLTPKNPFIATVEDGLGNVLMDGGFPKWYNANCNDTWETYAQLSPSFKYLYDAIDFISNNAKVVAGNRKVLIIGDHVGGDSYAIKSVTANGFKKSIDKVCAIKGYTPTYIDCSDCDGVTLNTPFTVMDQYCCIIFFSTAYTNIKKITNECIASLISYRESGNGIFFITDHGDRSLTSIAEANVDTNDYSAFYRTANAVVTNFGCYFSGNYDRSPVNVGYLRANYGNHILWANLLDSDYISAGGSESKIVITTYPLYTGNINLSIINDGYIPLKFLLRMADGTIKTETYTYGKNVTECLFFMDQKGIDRTSTTITTMSKMQDVNFRIDLVSADWANMSGFLLHNSTIIGEFLKSPGDGSMETYKNYDFGMAYANENILIQLEMFSIDSPDYENFYVYINGVQTWTRHFGTAGTVDTKVSQPAVVTATGSSSASTLITNINGSQSQWVDEVFNIRIPAKLDGQGKIQLGFGNTLDQSLWDEQYGVDDITFIDHLDNVIYVETFSDSTNGWSGGALYNKDSGVGNFLGNLGGKLAVTYYDGSTVLNGNHHILNVNDDDTFSVKMIHPIAYTKTIKFNLVQPAYSRLNKLINDCNTMEFKNTKTSSPFRNLNSFICNPDIQTKHFKNNFISRNLYSYIYG